VTEAAIFQKSFLSDSDCMHFTAAPTSGSEHACAGIAGLTEGQRVALVLVPAGALIGPGSIRPDSWQRPLKFWEITPDQWRRFVAVHTTAPWALANAVVPEMMRQGWGRIINVTTSLGTMLNVGSPTYGPSKAALEALSAIMAKDLDGTGVTVNVLVPGGVTGTPMISDEAGFDRDKLIGGYGASAPLARLRSRRESHRSALSRSPLGSRPSSGTSGREGWRPGGLDQLATMPITPSRS
jgi:NAD(P)-dependent dehydrogenase (short-subunit alcohol dehydrogenase family)